jgi:hypothetical protein
VLDIIHVPLDLIRCDEEIQTRDVLKGEYLERLKELFREDGPHALPPVVLFRDNNGVYWLADGGYRYTAACEVFSLEGPRALLAEVRQGTKRDAILYAAEANAKHGRGLSNDEKRRVVERLLKDHEWSGWPDRAIARHTGTSHVFVGRIRKELELAAKQPTIEAASGNCYQMPAEPTRIVTVQRGDSTYEMDVSDRGRAASTPPMPFSSDVKQDDHDGLEVTITKGLDRLKNAWKYASPAARCAFREWVMTQPVEDSSAVGASEKTQRNSAVIAEVCRVGSSRV